MNSTENQQYKQQQNEQEMKLPKANLLDTQYATQYLALAYILIQRVCITNSN